VIVKYCKYNQVEKIKENVDKIIQMWIKLGKIWTKIRKNDT